MKCSIIKIEESYGGPAVTDSGCEFDPIVALALLPHNGSKSFLKELSYLNVTKFSWRYFFSPFFCTKVINMNHLYWKKIRSTILGPQSPAQNNY
jgi:hypothetical protein